MKERRGDTEQREHESSQAKYCDLGDSLRNDQEAAAGLSMPEVFKLLT